MKSKEISDGFTAKSNSRLIAHFMDNHAMVISI